MRRRTIKRRTLFAQTAHTIGSMAGNQLLQIAAGIAISRAYGPSGKGLVTYAGIAILGAFAIADGLGSAIARQCGEKRSEAPAAYAASLRIVLFISAAFAIPLIIIGAAVPTQKALFYVGTAFPFALYLQTMSAFNLLDGHVERTNVASLATNAGAALAMLIVTLQFRPPIDLLMSIWTAGYLAGAAITFQGMTRIIPHADAITYSLKVQTNFALRSSSAALMTFLAARIDVFIIAATLSASALGNYTLALACGELMWQVGRSISWSAYGRIATATINVAAQLTAKVTRTVVTIEVLVAAFAFIVGPTLLQFIYGPSFSDAGPILRILLPGMTLYAGDAIISYFISVKYGRPNVILRIEFVTLCVSTIGSLSSVGRYGMLGPAIATTFAYLVSFSIKSAIFLRGTRINIRSLILILPHDLRRTKDSKQKDSAIA